MPFKLNENPSRNTGSLGCLLAAFDAFYQRLMRGKKKQSNNTSGSQADTRIVMETYARSCDLPENKPIKPPRGKEQDSQGFSPASTAEPHADQLEGLNDDNKMNQGSPLLCSSIIVHGSRKGNPCGQLIPCRYRKHKSAASALKLSTLSNNPSTPFTTIVNDHDRHVFDLSDGVSISPVTSPLASDTKQAEEERVTVSTRKNKVTVRLVDQCSQQQLRTSLDECLRDRAARKKTLLQLQSKYGESCYYLRHTEARATALASDDAYLKQAQVDHTFECQLIAHAVVQCPDYREILRQFDFTTKNNLITQQGFVVQGALRPVYDIQNNTQETELFNLKLLSPALNITKRFAYTNFLKYVYDVRQGDYNIRDDMERLLKKHVSTCDAVVIRRSLLAELACVEDPYVARLQGGIDPLNMRRNGLVSDRTRLEARMCSLAETVKQVFGDIQES
jgi:hypothetical protein